MKMIYVVSSEDNAVSYIADDSGYGHDHTLIRNTFNKGSYDNSTMPILLRSAWEIVLNNEGINCAIKSLEKGGQYWSQELKDSKNPEEKNTIEIYIPFGVQGNVNYILTNQLALLKN